MLVQTRARLVRLYEQPDSLVDQALDLLDLEWPKEAHMRGERRSSMKQIPGTAIAGRGGHLAVVVQDVEAIEDEAEQDGHGAQKKTPETTAGTGARVVAHAKISPVFVTSERQNCAMLYSLVVHPDLRGQRLGQKIVHAVLRWLAGGKLALDQACDEQLARRCGSAEVVEQPRQTEELSSDAGFDFKTLPPYLYLECKPALADFYQRALNFLPCEPAGANLRKVANKVEQQSVLQLENMLAGKLRRMQTAARESREVEVCEYGGTTWSSTFPMKKSCAAVDPPSGSNGMLHFRTRLLYERPLEHQVFFSSRLDESRKAFTFFLEGFPHQRQIGPSCGLVALHMAIAYLVENSGQHLKDKDQNHADGAPQLLSQTTEESPASSRASLFRALFELALANKYSSDGEMFSCDDMASLVEAISSSNAGTFLLETKWSGLDRVGARVVRIGDEVGAFSRISDMLTPGRRGENDVGTSTGVLLIPYNKDGSSHEPIIAASSANQNPRALEELQEHAHWGCVIGYEEGGTDDAYIAHGLSRTLIKTKGEKLVQSCRALLTSKHLCGRAVLVFRKPQLVEK